MRIFGYGLIEERARWAWCPTWRTPSRCASKISDGVNPRRVVYVRCKGKSDIPLTRIGQPLTLAEVEKQAADLAKFLGVPIEGLRWRIVATKPPPVVDGERSAGSIARK